VGYARHRALVGIGIESPERRDAMLHHAVEIFVAGLRKPEDAKENRAAAHGRGRNSLIAKSTV
jgi:hypothetical protein